jgi:hypothetical protein
MEVAMLGRTGRGGLFGPSPAMPPWGVVMRSWSTKKKAEYEKKGMPVDLATPTIRPSHAWSHGNLVTAREPLKQTLWLSVLRTYSIADSN